MKKDKIYSNPNDPLVKFTFDKRVADVFPDMIQRSVPGYTTTIAMIGVLAAQYAQNATNCYDLGSSLGAATLAMRKHIQKDVKLIAVDNSADMIERSRRIIERDHSPIPVEILQDDISDAPIKNASVVVMNFTLQFLAPAKRDAMIKKIYNGMTSGGIFILSEKVKFDDENRQKKITNWHHAFKMANGYSDLEVAGKRTALENVLIPETIDINTVRLERAGFKEVDLWFQCFNFISLAAIK